MDSKFTDSNVKLKVIGVGGAGNNAINLLIDNNIENVELWVANTDTQDLNKSKCPNKLALGKSVSRGFGAGGDPELGRQYALSSTDEIKTVLQGCDILVLSAGLGGGTGTGATPVIAQIAKEMNILTVAIVTTPFVTMEGRNKYDIALRGLEELKRSVDSYVVISNEKLVETYSSLPFMDALKLSNNTLKNAIMMIRDVLYETWHLNIDFNDLKRVFEYSGESIIGWAKATGKNKIEKAVQNAVQSPLFNHEINNFCKVIVIYSFDKRTSINDVQKASDQIFKLLGNRNMIMHKMGIVQVPEDDREDFFSVGIIASRINNDYHYDAVQNFNDYHTTIQNIQYQEPEPEKVQDFQTRINNAQNLNHYSTRATKGINFIVPNDEIEADKFPDFFDE